MKKVFLILVLAISFIAPPSFAADSKLDQKPRLRPNIVVQIRDMGHDEKGFPTYWLVFDQNKVERNRKSFTNTTCRSSDGNIVVNFSPALGIDSSNGGSEYWYDANRFSIHFLLGEDDGKYLQPPEVGQVFGVGMDDLNRRRNVAELSVSSLKKWYLISVSTKNVPRPVNTVDMICKTELRNIDK